MRCFRQGAVDGKTSIQKFVNPTPHIEPEPPEISDSERFVSPKLVLEHSYWDQELREEGEFGVILSDEDWNIEEGLDEADDLHYWVTLPTEMVIVDSTEFGNPFIVNSWRFTIKHENKTWELETSCDPMFSDDGKTAAFMIKNTATLQVIEETFFDKLFR